MKQFKHISQKKGFTLIELLVVIGILGILAAGLLAAIDPLEQLKKGRDQSKRNISVELTNAVTRYYAVFGSMPWGNAVLAPQAVTSFAASVNALTAVGELKPTFMGALPGNFNTALTVMGGSLGAGFAVCFDPESKSISRDPSTIFNGIGAYPPTQGTNPGDTDGGWFWCSR